MDLKNTIWNYSGAEGFIAIFCRWALCVNVDADTFLQLTAKEKAAKKSDWQS